MLILVDQDGVLADFELGFQVAWKATGHPHPVVPLDARRSFRLREEYPVALREQVEAIYHGVDFYKNLQPVDGAIHAINDLMELGHDVRICTSPLSFYKYCVPEKYEWVERHLGYAFIQRMIVTKDKTLVNGDFLIDDKPEVTGVWSPTWTHIIYDQPYNRQVEGKRLTWQSWRNVLLVA
jgi:5'-nucleotidase